MPLTVRSKRGRSATAPLQALPFGLPLPPADWPQKPAGISLCMIVKNEEQFLERCLQSVEPFVDEINIVDTGSTDRTIEIARSFGANVEQHAWQNDFSWARNKSVEMATRRWIMQLDADEELLPESAQALRSIANAPAHLTGIWLRCINASDKYKGGGSVSHAIIRIFPNHPRVRFRGYVHEFPSIDDSPLSMQAVVAPIRIVHHGYTASVVSDRSKYDRNLALVEQGVADHPDDAFHWYNYGQTTHLNGEHERAAPAFEKMWELCVEHGMRAFTANGLQMLADIYSEHLHQPETGLRWALECLQRSPRYANAHFSAGKAYFLLKRYDEAREMYAKAIDDGQYVDRQFVVDDEVPVWKAQCEIGSTYAEQGDHARALHWFEDALSRRPKVQPLRLNRARALENLGRLAEAEETLRGVHEDFPDESSTVEFVNFYLRTGKEREAIALIDAPHEGLSPIARISMLLAAAHVEQKNGWGDGRAHIEAAFAIAPHDAQVLAALEALNANVLVRALGLARAGDKTAALQALDVIPQDANAASAWLLKATLLREFCRMDEAIAALREVLARQPQHLDALLMHAQLAERAGDAASAEVSLQTALPLARTRVAVELAGLYLRTGRVAEAKRVAEEALA